MLANIFTLLLCTQHSAKGLLCFLLCNAKQPSELNSDISYILRVKDRKIALYYIARKVQGLT